MADDASVSPSVDRDQPRSADGPSRSAVVGIAAAALLVLVASLAARDVATVRNSALAARESLAAGLTAVETGKLPAARDHLADVEAHVAAAQAGTSGTFWRLAGRVPALETTIEVAEVTLDTAGAATAVASHLASHLAVLRADDGTTRIRDAQGELDLAPVRQAAAGIADVDLEPLTRALARLAEAPDAGVMPVVAEGREQTQVQGARLLSLGRDARVVAGVLPSFLGLQEPREYFLAMQNVAEGRGTGGLIGFFATIRVGQGRIELTQPQRYEVLDQVAAEGETPPIAPETLPDGFLERYGQFDPTTFLANANLDPDLPTVAEVLLNLYESQRGRRLDGVIAMDPIGLAYAHAPVGPVHLPPDTPTGGLGTSIPPARLARTLMVDAYDALGGPSTERKVYLARVAEAAFRGVTSGQWSALAMAGALATATDGGHLQLYSTRAEEQAAFDQLGVTGRLTAAEGHDLLAVTFNNSAGNKMDVHVGHTVSGSIMLEPDADGALQRTADLQVAVENPLPTSGRDIYIIGAHRPNLGFVEAFTDRAGLNRTWFTIWAPGTTTQASLTPADGDTDEDPDLDRLHGLVALDHVLETPSKTTRAFGASVSGPSPVTRAPDGSLLYRLRLHRQSKGIPDRLDLAFAAPEGWRVSPVQVHGGGQVPLFGVHGEPGPPVTAEVDGDGVRVTGDMTRAVTVVLRLQPTDANVPGA